MRQGDGDVPPRTTQTEFNHAANDSPRSGGSKRMTPVVWAVIVAVAVAAVVWLTLHA